MKIRSGFVSNSSSSSFIIGKPKQSLLTIAADAIGKKVDCTIKDVALAMLKSSKRIETYRKVLELQEPVNYIEFPAINEDTIIFKFNEAIIIKTCNNELVAWNLALDEIRQDYEVSDYAEDFIYDDDNYDSIQLAEINSKNGDGAYVFVGEWPDEEE